MSEVTVSISLTRAEQGKLFMKSNRQAKRITELKDALRRIRESAIANDVYEIKLIADAALEGS